MSPFSIPNLQYKHSFLKPDDTPRKHLRVPVSVVLRFKKKRTTMTKPTKNFFLSLVLLFEG